MIALEVRQPMDSREPWRGDSRRLLQVAKAPVALKGAIIEVSGD